MLQDQDLGLYCIKEVALLLFLAGWLLHGMLSSLLMSKNLLVWYKLSSMGDLTCGAGS
uniref:Uncharacterized protein n=1 Tax=Arundo donax TaxID=35708 RepID=A0A0A9D5N6_ARUDO